MDCKHANFATPMTKGGIITRIITFRRFQGKSLEREFWSSKEGKRDCTIEPFYLSCLLQIVICCLLRCLRAQT